MLLFSSPSLSTYLHNKAKNTNNCVFNNNNNNMEAWFLSPKPLTTKAIELLPSNSIPTKTRRTSISNHFCTSNSKPRIPSFISCCNSEPSSSPRNDDKQPLMKVGSDWRLFRANLVVREKNSRPTDLDTLVDYPQEGPIEDKWAHRIYEPEKGCVLIATQKLDGDRIFQRTVILLLSLGPAGPFGIILNRAPVRSVKEMRPSELATADAPFSGEKLFFGGPLEEEMFLVWPREGEDGVEKSGVLDEVMEGLYYGSKRSVGCAIEMVNREMVGVEDFRFFDGYCLWEKEQLRDEIGAGYWTVAACSPSVIGPSSVGNVGLWEEVLGLLGSQEVG